MAQYRKPRELERRLYSNLDTRMWINTIALKKLVGAKRDTVYSRLVALWKEGLLDRRRKNSWRGWEWRKKTYLEIVEA